MWVTYKELRKTSLENLPEIVFKVVAIAVVGKRVQAVATTQDRAAVAIQRLPDNVGLAGRRALGQEGCDGNER